MSGLTYAKFVIAPLKHPVFAIIKKETSTAYLLQYLFNPEVDVTTLSDGSQRVRPVVSQQGNLCEKTVYKTSVHIVEDICYEYELAYLTALTSIWHNDDEGCDMEERVFTDIQDRLAELMAKQSYTPVSSEWEHLKGKICKELKISPGEDSPSEVEEPFDLAAFLREEGFDLTSQNLAGKVIVHNPMDVLH